MASRNSLRSSALSMASAVAPIILTLNFSSTPILRKDSAQFSAVCPPIVGSRASGRSRSMILATISGEIGIGHDRRRIGIHQNDAVALVLQRLAGLRAGIIELTGLADDDRASANDQDRFDVCSFGHSGNATSLSGTKKGRDRNS